VLPKHLSVRRQGGVLKAVARGLRVPPEQHPKILRHTSRRPTEGERRRFLELQRRRDAAAAELGIDPTLIASRSMLSELAHDWSQNEDQLMEWQRGFLKA
jgi:ribonuclease D